MGYSHFGVDCYRYHALVRDFGGERPGIVVLCGSTRFYDAFQQANYDLTMAGCIVLSVGFYPHAKAQHGHGEGVGHDSAEKVALDELHLRKIDLADEVLVLNVDGYIGESTAREIAYAVRLGHVVRYLVCPACDGGRVLTKVTPPAERGQTLPCPDCAGSEAEQQAGSIT